MDRLHIRQATPKDIPTLQKLEENGGFDIPPRVSSEWYKQFSAYEYAEILEGVFIAELDSDIVGYTIITRVLDRHHICETVLHSDYHGQGLGQELMNFGSTYEKVFCEARVDNEPSRKMAYRCGFVNHSYIRNFYKDGSDAVLMVSKDWN